MNILICYPPILPTSIFDDTSRVVVDLGIALTELGHRIWWLSHEKSSFRVGTHIPYNENEFINDQIPAEIDVVHYHQHTAETPSKPHIITLHSDTLYGDVLNANTVFVSREQASRFGSDMVIYNGLDWDSVPTPNLSAKRERFHTINKHHSNLQGAIKVASLADQKIDIIEDSPLTIMDRINLPLTRKTIFQKNLTVRNRGQILTHSKGMIFPSISNPSYDLSIIESLYFGAPVFGSTYGALPEFIHTEFGLLSNSAIELSEAIKDADQFNPELCQQYSRDKFSAKAMAINYVALYEKVLSGQQLHPLVPSRKSTPSSKQIFQ